LAGRDEELLPLLVHRAFRFLGRMQEAIIPPKQPWS
jgi:hypothetical protein